MSMATPGGAPKSLSKVWYSKGLDPAHTSHPSNDQLLEMILALTSELSVLRDRLDTHERLAEAETRPTREAVEALEVDGEILAARSARRRRLLEKVLHVVRSELAQLNDEPSDRKEDATVEEQA